MQKQYEYCQKKKKKNTLSLEACRKEKFSSLFHTKSKYILFLPAMYIYCV